jgi:hypothetical protein
MKITSPEEARSHFEDLVHRRMRADLCNRRRAKLVERQNLGYFAGDYDDETAKRVRRLFGSPHPVFGELDPTEAEARAIGYGEALERGVRRAGTTPSASASPTCQGAFPSGTDPPPNTHIGPPGKPAVAATGILTSRPGGPDRR